MPEKTPGKLTTGTSSFDNMPRINPKTSSFPDSSDPVFRIMPVLVPRKIVHDHRNQQHDQRPDQNRRKSIHQAKLVNRIAADDGNQGCRASGGCVVFVTSMPTMAHETAMAAAKGILNEKRL